MKAAVLHEIEPPSSAVPAAVEKPYVLEVNRLWASYGRIEALRNLSLRVRAGQIVTIVGANGAGKSTLLNALMGTMPCKGEMLYEGQSLHGSSIEERVFRGISLVPETRELFPDMSVYDNLALGAFTSYVRGERNLAQQIGPVFERFPRLRERRNQNAMTLSGGERQMLALGRALLSRPRLLMLDEPSLGLAPLIVKDIFEMIGGLRSTGVSILLVEQNARAALKAADYAYVMENGEVKLEGAASELINDASVIGAYLGRRSASPGSSRPV
ncbi:ABC transporter family protein [Paraburkholderia xenovorans LB400]|nr:ABC transporter family protein [Paraburkholderia xenovorans LB400]